MQKKWDGVGDTVLIYDAMCVKFQDLWPDHSMFFQLPMKNSQLWLTPAAHTHVIDPHILMVKSKQTCYTMVV